MNNYRYYPYMNSNDQFTNLTEQIPYNNANIFTNSYYSKGENKKNFNTEEPYEGFIKGNIFKDLYDPYKNYKPTDIKPSNEKDYALLLVQIYQFAAHELNLYLDTHPNDKAAVEKRKQFVSLYEEALAQYENKYGALFVDSEVVNTVPFGWTVNDWPWEVLK